MAVELTSEQNERLERVLRLVVTPEMTASAVDELRRRMAWDLTHPDPPGEVHRIFEEFRRELGILPDAGTVSADELLGYDEFGLPT